MRYDQVTTTADLLTVAQMERYYDLRREAEVMRMLTNGKQEKTATATATANLFQRLRQWINAPATAPQTTTARLKGA